MARRKKVTPAKVPFNVEVDADEIACTLAQVLSFDQIHAFIVLLDRLCQDWGVTERLYEHFAEEMKKLPEDEVESSKIVASQQN